jgi:hypothetical protein
VRVKPTLQLSTANVGQTYSTSTPSYGPGQGSEPAKESLHGTVQSHRSSIFLHTPEPPAKFPARLSTPVWRALQLKALRWGGIVNFCWLGHDRDLPPSGQLQSATAFSALGGRLEIPEISLDNVDEVEEKMRLHAEGRLTETVAEEIHLYVCTHGARDCRCGNIGGEVVKALRAEVKERTMRDPDGFVSRVKIGEVGHVGGHQFCHFFILPWKYSNVFQICRKFIDISSW